MKDIDPGARIVGRDQIVIAAPLRVVWDLQADIEGWPSWRPGVDAASIDGPLAPGTVFRRRASGLEIASTIDDFDPPHRIAWSGSAGGISAIQVWTFAEHEGGVLVRTEESWQGEAADQAALDRSLRSWLQALRREAERRRPPAWPRGT